MYKNYQMELGGRTLSIDIGRVGKQANGCAFMHYGETTVLCTATSSAQPRDGIDFFPLSVEYSEKFYAIGKMPGGFNKREGRPSENAILTSRVIDRPMRPLFPKDMRNDVTLECMVMSVDPACRPELVAMIGASVATSISDIPFDGPCAMTQIGLVNGEVIVNPSQEQWDKGDLKLTVASTAEKVIMIEAGANEVPEADMISYIYKADEINKQIIAFINGIVAEVGKPKKEYTSCAIPEELFNEIKKIVQNRAGVAACAIALILVMALSLGSVLTAGAWDARSGSYVEGLGAWDAIRRTEQSHAGTLDDARVAEDMATYEEAQARWAQDADHLGSLSAQQMIDQYGIEFWREVDRVRSDAYYLRLKTAMLLDDKGTHAPGLQEGAGNFLSNELSGRYLGFFPYAESERSFWEGKASRIEWPIEYGSALAWGEILSFMAFYAFVTIAACIAVSGVFAGEYQGGTASIALPTLRGKRSLPVAKVVASMLFASAYWWASVAVGSGVFLVALGADGAGLPYQIFDLPHDGGPGVRLALPSRLGGHSGLRGLHAAALVAAALCHARGRHPAGGHFPRGVRQADRAPFEGRPPHAHERPQRLVRRAGKLCARSGRVRPAVRRCAALRLARLGVRATGCEVICPLSSCVSSPLRPHAFSMCVAAANRQLTAVCLSPSAPLRSSTCAP